MPRTIAPALAACLERANPRVKLVAELSTPDVGQVLRRVDQWTQAPTLVSMTPAASLVAAPSGPLQLADDSATPIASFAALDSEFDCGARAQDGQLRIRTLRWAVDRSFGRGHVKGFTATVRNAGFLSFVIPADLSLQIYTLHAEQVRDTRTGRIVTRYTPVPLLTTPLVVQASAQTSLGNGRWQATWDVTPYRLIVDPTPTASPNARAPAYYFQVTAVGVQTDDTVLWQQDNTTAETIAGVGSFRHVVWARSSTGDLWQEQDADGVPCCSVEIEHYAPAGGQAQAVYALDLGAAPSADSTGRVVFECATPDGTSVTLELAAAGSSGPWTAVTHGDVVSTRQQQYWLRVTLAPDAQQRATPLVTAFGVEFRTPVDVSAESQITPLSMECSAPWLPAAVGEGSLTVLRTGRRDYEDVATTIASTKSPTQLEAALYLASDHPSVTRDQWLLLDRATVSNRIPSATGEQFSLLSKAARLKRKIPRKIETISSVHTVASATRSAITVTAALPGTSTNGNEYDSKGYYIRVRSSAQLGIETGTTVTINGNTGTLQLDFSPALPGLLAAGDEIEVHSGVLVPDTVRWTDADLADIWEELLTVHAEIPSEEIGRGDLPRGGYPPHVADIAPDESASWPSMKATMQLDSDEEIGQLIDQVSFLLGGATIEIGGQLCFVQIYPLRGPSGALTITPQPVAAIFDARTLINLQTPPGLDARATEVSCGYGVDKTAANQNAEQPRTTSWTDVDALNWLTQQDLDLRGTAKVDDKIARWCYNAADQGLYLASEATRRVVSAASTGLRVWTWGSTEMMPQLVPGDSAVVITDQYTDYDPATAMEITGFAAYRLVLIGVGSDRREFTGYMLGLAGNVVRIEGGQGGDPQAPIVIGAPRVTASFDAAGHAVVTSAGDVGTASHQIGTGTTEAAAIAAAEAATAVAGERVTVTDSATYAPGSTVYIAAIALTADARATDPTVITVIREGTATAYPPTAYLYTDAAPTSWGPVTVYYAGYLGAGATGPLQWRRRIDVGGAAGTWGAWASTALPASEAIVRQLLQDTIVRLEVQDAGGQTADATLTLAGQIPSHDPGSGRIKHTIATVDDAGADYGYIARADLSDPAGLTLHTDITDASGRNVATVQAKADAALDASGNLNSAVTQSDGVAQRVIAKGHLQGTARNGLPVSFAQPFQNPPLVIFSGGISYEPRSKWNAAGDGNGTAAPLATAQYDEMAADLLDAGGFTCRARLRQRGTPTAHTDTSWGTPSLTGSGQTSEISPGTLPSAGDSYTVHYNVSLHSGLGTDASVTVAVDTFHSGDQWRNRSNQTYTEPAGGGTLTLTDETQQITVSGLLSGDKIRLRISALQAQTVTITPVSVTYTTAAGDQYASKTPETDDVVQWDAIAVE